MNDTIEEDEEQRCPKCGAELEFYANGESCSDPKCDHKYIYDF